MKTRRLLAGLALLLLSTYGCAEPEDPAPFETQSGDLAARLEADTGVRWAVYAKTNGASGGPEVLGPEKPVKVPGTTREDQTRSFFARYADGMPQLRTNGQMGAAEKQDDSDGSGIVKVAFVVPGTTLPIFGVSSSIHFDAAGAVRYVDPGPSVDLSGIATLPKLDREGAIREARAAIAAKCGEEVSGDASHELGAYPGETGKAVLAYRLEFDGDAGACMGPEVFVDAVTGRALAVHTRAGALMDLAQGGRHYFWRADDVKTIAVSQRPDASYELADYTGKSRVFTSRANLSGGKQENRPVTSPVLGMWGDIDRGVSVDAHFHAQKALEFFRVVFGRNGIDGRGSDLQVVTDDATGPNEKGPNAFYRSADGTIRFSRQYREVQLESGAKRTFYPMSLSYDVVVHELAHGIVHHTSDLVYENESGAINESFADVMGVSAEHWLPETKGSADMILGKEIATDGLGLRDVLDPTSQALYNQHDNYAKRYKGPKDEGGVHRNSGIGNRAFSLMTLGGKTNVLSIPRALGFEASRYIWWETVTRATDPNLTWRKLALSQTILAKNMGFETNASVACAWVAVGVVERHEVDPDFTKCGLPATSPVQASCAGVEKGVVCSDITRNTAYICRNGAIAGAHYCSDFSKTCSHPAETFRGSLDARGTLVCQ
jgi:bacillolysin